MPQKIMHTGAIHSSSRSVAHQRRVSGISLPKVDPVQRVISINNVSNSVDAAYSKVVEKAPGMRVAEAELFYGILPVYDHNNEVFADIDQLVNQLRRVIKTYAVLYNTGGYQSLSDYIFNQRVAQDKIKNDPQSFKHLVTTAGFEHEFADMKDSPLAGVSHLELAKSNEQLPFTDLPFIVETDALNALELVSPPFLFPTSGGGMAPKSSVVGFTDDLIRSTLYNLLTQRITNWAPDSYYNREYITQTLTQLLAALGNATGLTFHLINNIAIKPEHLSHNTNIAELSNHVAPDGNDPNKLIFNAQSAGNIHLSGSKKQSGETYNIGAQLNFATDIATIMPLLQQEGYNATEAILFRNLGEELGKHMPLPSTANDRLKNFHVIMINKLAGLFAVHSQEQLKGGQAKLHAQLVSQAQPNSQPSLPLTAKELQQFKFHAWMASFVKDVTPLWVKDHLLSIAKGMLAAGDYPVLSEFLHSVTLTGWNIPVDIATSLHDLGHDTIDTHWGNFIQEGNTCITNLLIAIDLEVVPNGGSPFMNLGPGVDLYDHNPLYAGVRQDTYLDPNRVQMPGIHDKRLHVAEIRRGDPVDTLKKLEK